jgi:hypothetical protein
MTKNLLVDGILEPIVVRESLARGSIGNTKVLRQARYIVIGHCNSGMSAAVAGTLVAVESLNRCSLVCVEDVWCILQQVEISQPPLRGSQRRKTTSLQLGADPCLSPGS